jgi:hypothetical protein
MRRTHMPKKHPNKNKKATLEFDENGKLKVKGKDGRYVDGKEEPDVPEDVVLTSVKVVTIHTYEGSCQQCFHYDGLFHCVNCS